MKIQNISFNQPQNRFYPRYGAFSVRRKSNLYKNGKTKGANKIENKLEKQVQFLLIFKNEKQARKQGKVNLYG